MSHPDPLYDPENSEEDDMNYDDYNDFHGVEDENEWEDFDDSMDGDFDSAMRDAGFGTDEDYGHYGDDIDAFHDYYGGE
jgi:hypothetical protein